MTISKRLRALRAEKGLIQRQCADELGVDLSNYNKWENEVNPSLEMLCKIANYFNVSTDYLLGQTDFLNAEEESAFNNPQEQLDIQAFNVYRKMKGCFELIRKIDAFRPTEDLFEQRLGYQFAGSFSLMADCFQELALSLDFNDQRFWMTEAIIPFIEKSKNVINLSEYLERIDELRNDI